MTATTAILDRLVDAGDVDGVVRRLEGLARKVVGDFYAPGLERDDLLQEARLGIAEAVRDFNGTGAFQAFAYYVARRRVLDAVTAARRGKHQILNEAASLHAPPPLHDLGPDATLADILPAVGGDAHHRLEVAAELAAIVARLDVLSPIERDVLGLWLSEIPYKEIGARVGRSAKVVDNALQRATRKLRGGDPDTEPAASVRPRHGVLLVDRLIHRDERAARREARRVLEDCLIGEISRKKVRGGRVVAPQGRPGADGSLGRPVWAIEVLAA